MNPFENGQVNVAYSRLSGIIAIVPFIAASLYYLGVCYHKGYLASFGLSDVMFPLSVDQTILRGFFAVFGIGITSNFGQTVLAISLLFLSSIMVVGGVTTSFTSKCCESFHSLFCLSFFQKVLRVLSVKIRISGGISRLRWVTDYLIKTGVYFCLTGVILTAVYAAGVAASIIGTNAAKEIRSEEVQTNLLDIADMKGGGRIAFIFKPVICNSTYCAYWEVSSHNILIKKNDSIVEFQAFPPASVVNAKIIDPKTGKVIAEKPVTVVP